MQANDIVIPYQQKAKKIIYRREKAKLTKFNKDIISKYDLQYTEDTLSKRPDILVLDILDTKGITYIRPILLAVTIISKTAFGVPQRKDFFNEFAEEMLKNKTLKEKFVKFMQYADLVEWSFLF